MNERKQAILDAVARWLDEHPQEPLPAGLVPELGGETAAAPPDLLALVGAVTACRHDVQLQGKAFRRLDESIAALLATKVAPAASAAGAETPAETLLMELYERIERCRRGAATAQDDLPLLLSRRRAGALLDGIAAGLELTRGRLDEALAGHDLQAFDPLGEDFDPQRMRSVATRPPSQGERAGQVVETLAVGFARNGNTVQPATVKLAR